MGKTCRQRDVDAGCCSGRDGCKGGFNCDVTGLVAARFVRPQLQVLVLSVQDPSGLLAVLLRSMFLRVISIASSHSSCHWRFQQVELSIARDVVAEFRLPKLTFP